jgi:hypothetical protein
MVERKKIAFLIKNPPKMRGEDMKKGFRHYWLSISVLAQLRHDFLDNRISFLEDPTWGSHVIALLDNGVRYSCFCSGFDKYIDVVKLTPKGTPDNRTGERRFATSMGVIHFLKSKERK